jgi:hypothetical protein
VLETDKFRRLLLLPSAIVDVDFGEAVAKLESVTLGIKEFPDDV